jgi:Zn-dependent protease
VAQFGKLIRWFFGLNAVLFSAIALRYILGFPPLVTHVWDGAGESVMRLLAYAVLAAIFLKAFLALGKGAKDARYWALGASALNLPFYWIVSQAWMWTAVGVAGLVIFSRRENVEALVENKVKPARARGDGTSSSVDMMANTCLFIGFVAAGYWWASWAPAQKLSMDDGIFVRLLLIEAAMLLTTLVHESGHALAAVLLKMKLRRIVVGPVEASFRSGRWHLKLRFAGFLGAPGGVGVVPTTLDDLRRRHALVAAAGPFASLLLGVVCLWIALTAKGNFWEAGWKLAAYTATFTLLSFLFNLIPMRPESVYSDGARIYQLLGRSPWSDVHLALSMGSCMHASSMRPRDCDTAVLERAAAFLTRGMEALLLRVELTCHHHDAGRIPEALAYLAEAEWVYSDSILDLRADLHKSFVFANAFLKRDATRAREWWQRMEAKGSATKDAEYWLSLSALHWVEGDLDAAEQAWGTAVVLIEDLPRVGAHDYDRDCMKQLRAAIAMEVPALAVA